MRTGDPRKLATVVTAALFVVIGNGANADPPLYNKPMYDASSKRYFELVYAHDKEWREDRASAQQLSYEGVRGELAIVDSIDVHEFLLTTFHPDVWVWIGIVYKCPIRALQDAAGKPIPRGSFQAWAPKWTNDIYACNRGDVPKAQDYAPVAYSTVEQGFRWLGWGSGKKMDAYFVEFRTGHP